MNKSSSFEDLSKTAGGKDGEKKASGKGAKSKEEKDPFAPTQAQIQAMLDDLLLLDSLGIDGVEELEEIVIEEETAEEEIPMELLDRQQLIQRRRRDLEKKKELEERGESKADLERLKQMRAEAVYFLERALDTKSEKDVKQALKLGIKVFLSLSFSLSFSLSLSFFLSSFSFFSYKNGNKIS